MKTRTATSTKRTPTGRPDPSPSPLTDRASAVTPDAIAIHPRALEVGGEWVSSFAITGGVAAPGCQTDHLPQLPRVDHCPAAGAGSARHATHVRHQCPVGGVSVHVAGLAAAGPDIGIGAEWRVVWVQHRLAGAGSP